MGMLNGTIVVMILKSLFGGLIGFAFIAIIINGLIMPFQKKKALEDAIKDERVITAKRYDWKRPRGEENRFENYIWGYYSYEYGNNRTRKFRLSFYGTPPETLTLYYKKNPAKARTEKNFGNMESGYLLIFIITTFISFLLI